MPDLESLLKDADHVAAPDLWGDIRRRTPRRFPPDRGPLRRVATMLLALAVAAAGIAVAVETFTGEREEPRPTDEASEEIDAQIIATIPVGQFPAAVAVGEDAVWVTVNQADPPGRWEVVRIDPATNEITDRISVHEAVDVAAGAGGVWVGGYERGGGPALFRIDPTSREIVATIPFECPRFCGVSEIVATGDHVWVSLSSDYPDSGRVIRIDPVTNEVTSSITVEGDPRDIAVGEGGVWVYSLTHFKKGCCVTGATIYRVDPTTGEVVARFLPGQVSPVAGVDTVPVVTTGHGFAWTIRKTTDEARIDGPTEPVRIDPGTGQVEAIPLPGVDTFLPFAADDTGVWFRGGPTDAQPVIAHLDARSLMVDESLPLEKTIIDAAHDPATGTIWLANYDRKITRIESTVFVAE